MSAPGAGKICVLCNEDCSDRPRIKDPRGRYYCRDCYERARAQRAAVGGTGSGEANAAPEPEALEDVTPPPPAACPHCRSPIVAGAVLCTNCGYDLRSGERRGTAAPGAEVAGRGSAIGATMNNPLLWSAAVLLIYTAVIVIGRQMDDVELGASIAGGWHTIFSLLMTIVVLVAAFQTSVGQGLLTLCVPLYVFWFVYAVCEEAWIKLLFSANLVGTVAFVFAFGAVTAPGDGGFSP